MLTFDLARNGVDNGTGRKPTFKTVRDIKHSCMARGPKYERPLLSTQRDRLDDRDRRKAVNRPADH